MRAHSLAKLICVDGQGAPFLTPLPLKFSLRGVVCRLLGPVARAHPHAGRLAARPLTLAGFKAAQAYGPVRLCPDLLARVRTRWLGGKKARNSRLHQARPQAHTALHAACVQGLQAGRELAQARQRPDMA